MAHVFLSMMNKYDEHMRRFGFHKDVHMLILNLLNTLKNLHILLSHSNHRCSSRQDLFDIDKDHASVKYTQNIF
jgi:hypothetical protein